MSRYLIYSHDSYGLGHFRRCTLLASGLVAAGPDNDVLIVTGSPRAQSFRLPERVDTIKLPTATKDRLGGYQPRKLRGPLDRLVRLRSGVVTTAFAAFDPDTIIVDHAPSGMAGELLPLFDVIESFDRRPSLVLGVRDIIDESSAVEAAWDRDGVWSVLERYDEILVYGDERITTTAQELDLATRCSAPVTHVGYVAPSMPGPLTGEPYLLVTAGGGGDGQALLRRVLAAVERGATGGMRVLLVTGPLLSAGRRAELAIRAAENPGVEVIEFSDQMRSLVASAAGVISMAGYNTVVEELAARVPALLVPRCVPRLEQNVRATRLAARTDLEHCDTSHLTPKVVAAFVRDCVDRPRTSPLLDLRGVETVARHLDAAPQLVEAGRV